ncbi:PA14 domain-containing protein [Chitinophaga rupis]|uniref:PA14 domain-containing protein n=1 Tax=Chitinophaga rupis TaxID=573321 RepID=A0A1H7ULG1_9BACT|nr:PA14 domain-containing protein [Chitinophaga rupis]SEL97574.1 PA14 domain-containing protein [Chitinophaga rupis]
MILALVAKGKKTIACGMLALIYLEMVIPSCALGADHTAFHNNVRTGSERVLFNTAPVVTPPVVPVAAKAVSIGGPTQPESQSFHSVGNDNMVDLFSGDFSYNIPLLDVGGYPVALGYSSGISMDQEASWVGLGWNINPGTITRNMRGLPDDFNGVDSIVKTATVKENKTIGVTAAGDIEILGFPLSLGASLGIRHNSYRGIGLESGISASINAASGTAGSLGAGLSLTNSSQDGLTISPSLSYSLQEKNVKEEGGYGGSVSTSLSYNTRSGMKALQYSAGITQYVKDENTIKNAKKESAEDGIPVAPWVGQTGASTVFSSYISYAYPTFTPTINLPYTSRMYTVTLKAGAETKIVHPSLSISGYISKQWIAAGDRTLYLPAYGYLNYQNGSRNPGALLDFNREKEIPYRNKPEVPNIAVPAYTYDIFTMSGEGTGGSFRAYRGDIGFVYDHRMKTNDQSGSVSADAGFGDIFHGGIDINYTYANTLTGPWQGSNPLAATIAFKGNSKNYEAVYFRNPGEKAINTRAFYDSIGGDYTVIPKLYQSGNNSPFISTTNYLTKYANGQKLGDVKLTANAATRQVRDKRTQVISYLSAAEAGTVGLNKYIENYRTNQYALQNCDNTLPDGENSGPGKGLRGDYFNGKELRNYMFSRVDPSIRFNKDGGSPYNINLNLPSGAAQLNTEFSVRWTGRIKAPVSGKYIFSTESDDGVRLFLNNKPLLAYWDDHSNYTNNGEAVYLEAGQMYDVKLEYYQNGGHVMMTLAWEYPGQPRQFIPTEYLYEMPKADTFSVISNILYREKRVNSFRKSNHISEIDVLNADGKRYVYGLPVYNLKQKETTFSVKHENGNAAEGTVTYNPGSDNTTGNTNGNDNYFNSEEIPAYAHSFLLTGIVSPDYVDVTGNGISGDDLGDAIKFNYTKIAGVGNPFKWRTPYASTANFNEGLKTDTRDDKGSYVYGEKELWYLNSIESKNMIATFKVADRNDLVPIDENGNKDTASHVAKRLEEINLYTKADFLRYGTNARPVKTVHFDYTYELCQGINAPKNNGGKLTLKRVWFTYNGNNKGRKNAYVFNYNSNNPGYNTKSYDRWGTYKDPLQNPGSSASNLITNAEYPYALQDSTAAAKNAAAWTLDSIVLPSGGRMKITYESDDYAYVQNKRATQMLSIAGFSSGVPSAGNISNRLYSGNNDNLYVAIHVPQPVSSKAEVYRKYLEGNDTMYFRLNVRMPADKFGKGNEFVPCYARLEKDAYGIINSNTIWVKLQGIDTKGSPGGSLSPLAKAAIQFLRLNLPSKAYPGSDVGDNLDLADGIKVLFSLADNIKNALSSYDGTARNNGWARDADLSRSFVRLNSPGYKKYGGGLRVKRIMIYDNWKNMTGQKEKESVYGTEYKYTTSKKINGVNTEISSGVAAYEPIMGGEENPWHLPIEYKDQAAPLAPTNMGYVEQPLGEAFFPGASVGYSKVRTKSIHSKNTRSASGFEETCFFTAYDFPVITEHSLLDKQTKLTYKPKLATFLRFNAANYLVMSQGFKVELNDMHGKPKSHAVYPETDSINPISYTENYYHVDNLNDEIKHLNNTVLTMNAQGEIDTLAQIGKDMELMMDMREQYFLSIGANASANGDIFSFAIPPVLGAVSFLGLPQSEETLFRSAAATKVITRHGILDSVLTSDKGSKVTTHNLLYDGETGDVLLTSAQNEYGDPIYAFNYPAGWVYDGMSGAYKNINVSLDHVNILEGKITSDVPVADYFASGDEILIYTKNKVSGSACAPDLATFPGTGKIWVVDANALNGNTPNLFFMDQEGAPFTGNDVTLKVVRSGRKNMPAAAVGSVNMLVNPLVKTGGKYNLVIDKNSKIINATVTEYKQNWQVQDRKKQKITCAYEQ